MNPLQKLKSIVGKKRIIVEDPFIESIMKAMPSFSRLVGEAQIELAAGVKVSIATNMNQEWTDRLQEIYRYAQSIADQFDLDRDHVAKTLIKHDGWVLTKGRMKTPAWMMHHVEVEFSKLPVELEWLARFA